MQKVISIIFLIFFSSFLFAQQEDQQFIHKHLLRADASIVKGYMLKEDFQTVHLNGNLEYYTDNRISIRGDANYMLGSNGLTSDSIGLLNNISVMLGASYHFHTKGHFDPYFILQPGFAYTSSYKDLNGGFVKETSQKKYYNGAISPLATAGLGFNYYFQRFAHLFLETRYVYGQHLSNAPSPISLQEVRITFGLGFNLFIIKEKKESRS
jgi:hypothetical protein